MRKLYLIWISGLLMLTFCCPKNVTCVEKREKIDSLIAEQIDRVITELVVDINDDFRKADKGIRDAKDSVGTAMDTAAAAMQLTLDDVTTNGNTTGNNIEVNSIYTDVAIANRGRYLYMRHEGVEAEQGIYFREDASNTGESFLWDDTNDIFRLSEDLGINNTFLYMNYDGPDEQTQSIYFYDGNATGKYVRWSGPVSAFYMNDDLYLTGGSIYAGNSLVAQGDNAYIGYNAGSDGDRNINFREGGSNTGETFHWDNVNDRFELSDDFYASGTIESGTRIKGSDVEASDSVVTAYLGGASNVDLDWVTDNGYRTYNSLEIGTSLTLDFQESAVDQFLYFYNVAPQTEYLQYDYGQRFILSDDLTVDGDLRLNGVAFDLNYDGGNADQYVYFYHGSARQKYMKWSSSATRFEFNDDVYSSATIESGTDMKINGGDLYFAGENLNWDGSKFNLSDDLSAIGDITNSGNVRADGDVETESNVHINKDSTAADAYLYFHNNLGDKYLKLTTGFIFELNAALDLTPSNATLTVGSDLIVEGHNINIGDGGGFSGVKFNTSTTRLEFWIDGVMVGYIGTDGVYVDNVP